MSEDVIPGIAALSVGDPKTPVPEGWTRVRLTDVARLESGHTPSRKHPEYWDGDIPWVSLPDARKHHGGIITETTQHTNELGLANSAARLLPADTVCLSRTASVGYVFRLGRPMATSQDFVNWVCSDALEPRFLMFALIAEGDHILNFGKGSTHTTIYFPEVLAFHIALPPLPEQRRIVEKAEASVEAVSNALVHVSSAADSLRRFGESVANAAADGSLIDEPCRSVKTLADLLREPLANGRSIVDDPSGFPVLRLNAITRRGIDLTQRKLGAWTADEARRFLIQKNDFFVSRGNGSLKLVGRGALVHDEPDLIAYPDTLIRVRTDQKKLDPKYLEIVWNSRAVRDQIEAAARTTAGIHKISQRDLERIEIPFAEPEMQQLIIRRHAALVRASDVATARVHAVQERAEKLTQSILAKAFAGELVPTEAEVARVEGRSYEPAPMLLQRIRRTTGSAPARRCSR